jgi:hypothetical protein
MSPSEVEAIDDWGFAHRIRTRAEAIRRLAAMGLMFEDVSSLMVDAVKFIAELQDNPVGHAEKLDHIAARLGELTEKRKNSPLEFKLYHLYEGLYRIAHDTKMPYLKINDLSEAEFAWKMIDEFKERYRPDLTREQAQQFLLDKFDKTMKPILKEELVTPGSEDPAPSPKPRKGRVVRNRGKNKKPGPA